MATACYTCKVVVRLIRGRAGFIRQTSKTKLQSLNLRILIPASTPTGETWSVICLCLIWLLGGSGKCTELCLSMSLVTSHWAHGIVTRCTTVHKQLNTRGQVQGGPQLPDFRTGERRKLECVSTYCPFQ